MVDQFMKAACLVVCPWCEEEKCVGRHECPQIKAWIEEAKGGNDHA